MVEKERIESVYRTHPLCADAILRRLGSSSQSDEQINELDLALDPVRGITDQNHLGGAAAVLAIANAVGVTDGTRVLDIGSGLGGPARLLAHTFGCRVLGIEMSPDRIADSRELTQRVGLHERVSFVEADFLQATSSVGAFDLVLLLDSLVHFADEWAVLSRADRALVPGGSIAIDNPFLRGPSTDARLKEMNRLWASHLSPASRTLDWLQARNYEAKHEEYSAMGLRFFNQRVARPELFEDFPQSERDAWALARELMLAGIVTYERIIATKPR